MSQLPIGNSSILSTATQSLSFHKSPELFISSLSLPSDVSQTNSPPRKVVRGRLLNRDVAIVSAYQTCRDVLSIEERDVENAASVLTDGDGKKLGPATFSASLAYSELMSDFFPQPNLLIESFPTHEEHRKLWESSFESFPKNARSQIRRTSIWFFKRLMLEPEVDLYKSMKILSWHILLGTVLNLREDDEDLEEIQRLQETILVGQFSLFRVSIRTPFWNSPRSKGIDASRILKNILVKRLLSMNKTHNCPFSTKSILGLDDIASHCTLFTSSLAVKAVASLLTATMLNFFVQPQNPPLYTRFDNGVSENNSILLNSIILETERLSPPVVGIMRRVQTSVILSTGYDKHNLCIPAGWDVWMYFVHANRDEDVFPVAETFQPERYLTPESLPLPMSFGHGSKACLGQELVRTVVSEVMRSSLDLGLVMEGEVMQLGVRSWLGWESDVAAADYAQAMKQLPVQRPRNPLKVRFRVETRDIS
jgi:cytochrome P450